MPGEFLAAEAYGLDVVHVQVAEGEQPAGQGVGDGLFLVGRERPLTREASASVTRAVGEPPDLLLAQRSLLAPERHQRRQPYRPVNQSRPRSVLDEQLLHQRAEQAGSQLAAQYGRLHPPPVCVRRTEGA
ncbi:hypothetical protein LT493_36870 [Streptomyces tricolor]|nr:hypothetical protein [Streptomyces tricolor]